MLKDKAAANLKAGETLLALGLTDPAASRYYYALYQASVYALQRRGLTPGRLQSGAVEWRHATVLNNVFLVRGRRSDRDLYEIMRRLRTAADYSDEPSDPDVLACQLSAVRRFVAEVTL